MLAEEGVKRRGEGRARNRKRVVRSYVPLQNEHSRRDASIYGEEPEKEFHYSLMAHVHGNV